MTEITPAPTSQPGRAPSTPTLPTTFTEAANRDPYALARLWGELAADGQPLTEVAIMSALQCWLDRLETAGLHRALAAGHTPAQVAAASGLEVDDIRLRWSDWAEEQREINDRRGDPYGLPAGDYFRVARALADAVAAS